METIIKMKIIVLTLSDKHKSPKNGGYCVAGIDPDNPRSWVRLIGAHEHFKITDDEAIYENGKLCEPLDIIEVDAVKVDEEMCAKNNARDWGVKENPPFYYLNLLKIQPENYLVNGRFRFIEKADIDTVLNIMSFNEDPYIFSDTDTSLSIDDAIRNNSSLTMMKVEDLELYPKQIINTGEYQSHYKARFRYNGVMYDNITVTDPEYLAKDSDYAGLKFGETYMIMSLGEEYNNRHYKLIAKIFEVVYVIEGNKMGMYHAFRDCRYLEKYKNVKYALSKDASAAGMKPCAECQKRYDSLIRPQE